jgi:IS30 family transposase
MTTFLWSTRDIAAYLQKAPSWASRNLRRLQRDHGFPSAVPGIPHRYNPDQVRAWAEGRGAAIVAPAAVPVDWANELDRRAEAMAHQQ